MLGNLKWLALAAMLPAPLQAQDIAVQSRIYFEQASDGGRTVSDATTLREGDRVVAVLDWNARRSGTTITSAIPAHLSFLDASEDELEVSTDGGRNWRQLADSSGGQVTHLRWRTATVRGRLAYSAIVR